MGVVFNITCDALEDVSDVLCHPAFLSERASAEGAQAGRYIHLQGQISIEIFSFLYIISESVQIGDNYTFLYLVSYPR